MYVLCWSARRFGLFGEAEEFAIEGIKKFATDPRFHHGWALSVFARRLKDQSSTHSLDEAVAVSERALDLYKSEANREQVAGCHNNTAYMLAYEVRHGTSTDQEQVLEKLARARQHIESLKEILEKKEWKPDHPQFFHTEAFLAHQEVQKKFRQMSAEEIKAKLLSTKDDISEALNLFDCELYDQLKKEVDNSYQRLVRAHER